jgi:DNA-binding IclR family transcriptional regulator
MGDVAGAEGGSKHQIPVIDRMMDILEILASRSPGATISDLVDALAIPRTTVYRILNTLQEHKVVRRSVAGSYTLGPRLLALASRVAGDCEFDLPMLVQPHLQRLSDHIGEGSKITVLDGDRALVLVAVQGKREYALAVTPGQRLPLHAGAAGKVLLADMEEAARTRVLQDKLERYSPKTITDPKRLVSELARIRRAGWAQDRGEFSPSIQAFAAPIIDPEGRVIAALSVPFLAGTSPERQDHIRAAVLSTAAAITADLPRPARRDQATEPTQATSTGTATEPRRRYASTGRR